LGAVQTALCRRRKGDIQAVVFHLYGGAAKHPDHLTTMNSVVTATKHCWRELEEVLTAASEDRSRGIRVIERGRMRIFLGCERAGQFDRRLVPGKGIYIFASHLKPSTVQSLGLHPIAFRNSSVVVQIEDAEAVASNVDLENKAEATPTQEVELDKDSIAWRKAFVSRYKCLSAEEVAEEAGNKAANRSALASRWATDEKKIFSIRHGNKTLFPKFQFRDGYPIPAVAKILRQLPEHYTGWDKAFFFTTSNPYLNGKKPVDVLSTQSEKVISAAEAFAHPADAF
jgi:hypothetical protein